MEELTKLNRNGNDDAIIGVQFSRFNPFRRDASARIVPVALTLPQSRYNLMMILVSVASDVLPFAHVRDTSDNRLSSC
jgi:hypothetical protein